MPAAQRSHTVIRVAGLALLAVGMLVFALFATCIRTDDQNHDGRPDVWRSYNRYGQIVAVSRDTNFDGRSDVQEYYERGALVRRESDRDFNDRVDLVQHFDPLSREIVRAVVDLNGDGIADVLFLFRDGQPVYAKLAPQTDLTMTRNVGNRAAPSHGRSGRGPLVPLDDPFSGDLALRAVNPISATPDFVATVAPFALPEVRGQPARLTATSRVLPLDRPIPASQVPASSSPRGPPSQVHFA